LLFSIQFLLLYLRSSTESIDQLGQREKYMLQNFDLERRASTSGLAGGTQRHSISSSEGKSISSKFYSSPLGAGGRDDQQGGGDGGYGGSQAGSRRSSIKNLDAIEQALEPQGDALKKRLELRKQIEESRRKLESVSLAHFFFFLFSLSLSQIRGGTRKAGITSSEQDMNDPKKFIFFIYCSFFPFFIVVYFIFLCAFLPLLLLLACSSLQSCPNTFRSV
jgi:hypothetical protein